MVMAMATLLYSSFFFFLEDSEALAVYAAISLLYLEGGER
jgi:hypothetical protein